MTDFYSMLPHSVEVEGKAYKINTDFRVWIEIEKLLNAASPSFGERVARCFALAYVQLPPSPTGALEALLDFYASSEGNRDKTTSKASSSAPLYNLGLDSVYIYSSFMSQYGIDLTSVRLHWWKFRALLCGLDEATVFSKVVAYRGMDIHSITDPQQKQFYEKMKRLYALPDNRSEEEKEQGLCESMECLF